MLRRAVDDKSADVRLFAVRWISDERIVALREDVARLLEGPQPNQRYYLAVLGAVDWLDHKPGIRGAEITDELLVRELQNEHRSPEAHALALSLLKPDDKFLTINRLRGYLSSTYQPLGLEAIRSLAQQNDPERFPLLATMVGDESQTDELRAEAIVGLSAAAKQNRELLEKLAKSKSDAIRCEAARALCWRGCEPRLRKQSGRRTASPLGKMCWKHPAMRLRGGGCFSAPSGRAAACAIATAVAAVRLAPTSLRSAAAHRAKDHRVDPPAKPGNRTRLSGMGAPNDRWKNLHRPAAAEAGR